VSDTEVVIVGGGISGLSTAYFLATQGIRSTIVEKSNRLGGLIRTDLVEGCRLEAGPDSYLATKPAATELARELGDLGRQIIGSNDKARRIFIVRHGKLVPMPEGMVMMVPARLMPALRSELFSFKTKLGFVSEALAAPRDRAEDVSLEAFILDHFEREVLDYVAEPLLTGVYGGAPANLSAQSVLPRFVKYEQTYGSLIRGVRREQRAKSRQSSTFLSFERGMQSLTDSLARAAETFQTTLCAPATRVGRTADGWLVQAGAQSFTTDHVVLACPAHACSELLARAEPNLAAKLAEIPYSSAVLVTLAYKRSSLPRIPEGFGFLVPQTERRHVAAATWVSTKFPSRVPAETAVSRAFIVGSPAEELSGVGHETLLNLVRAELRDLAGIEVQPLFHTVHIWPKSMPQYVVGHAERRREIARMLDATPGLYLVGNAYDGVGIPDCVSLAKETAKRITASLKGNSRKSGVQSRPNYTS